MARGGWRLPGPVRGRFALIALLCPILIRGCSNPFIPNPPIGTLHRLNSTHPSALCLDGTSGVFYHVPGTGTGADKWFITQEGGGWCYSAETCKTRAGTPLGSSKKDPETQTLCIPPLSMNSTLNPLFHNWNKVYMRYCDGFSFSGNRQEPWSVEGSDLWLRGHHILNGVIDTLIDVHEIEKSSEVVVAGCSAGGLTTYLQLDYWADRIKEAATSRGLPSAPRVLGMPQSGFFLDFQASQFPFQIRYMYYLAQAVVNQDCVVNRTKDLGDPSDCAFAQHVAPFIKTPFFLMQSKYDLFQTLYILNPVAAMKDAANINYYGSVLLKLLKDNVLTGPKAQQRGAFVDSCHRHCEDVRPNNKTTYVFDEQVGIKIGGMTQASAFYDWWKNPYQGKSAQHIEDMPYPCKTCCAPWPPSKAAGQ